MRNPAALPAFGLAAAGAALAASAWATGLREDGLRLDPRLWREEVVASNDDTAEEGWYELTVSAGAVQVRAARPRCADDAVPPDALYVQLPGVALREGLRVNHLFDLAELAPRPGHEYRRALGKTVFSFVVTSAAAGMQVETRYAGMSHRYLLGAPDAAVRVHAASDLDGDRLPDFVVQVGGEVFLLLSTHALAGLNLPSAQLWAAR